ncbi:hypothetical protein JQ615_38680 [Bradyrhizobium jicamae]|uniref:Uncharacterized protein n=1 Tax=Bradyrhizobium jicamae TaxID=280332 RepID=A0ABS5FWQ0_9BRAD|nr:hypothetical protein [Bradyrhizobium jicamae]MBR0801289.1 hypothetical protein [Bradyrhizobium jicamae]MBR0938212.1 hypothetical protein [Bradyrhizobium jicamae]
MRPTTAAMKNVIELGILSRMRYARPADVLSNLLLTKEEKTKRLASWTSDASAVTSMPSLRAHFEPKWPIQLDEILRALSALDEEDPRQPPGSKPKRLQATDRVLVA